MHNEKIELQVPKEDVKKLRDQRKRLETKFKMVKEKADDDMSVTSSQVDREQDEQDDKKKCAKEDKDMIDDDSEFYSDEDDQQRYVDDRKIDYHTYRYTVQQGNSDLKPSYETKDLTIRKLQYVTGEILNDLGIKKLDLWSASGTIMVAFSVLWLRMILHYLG